MATDTTVHGMHTRSDAAPVRDAARGLLGDCDLRWLALIAGLCALVLRLIAAS